MNKDFGKKGLLTFLDLCGPFLEDFHLVLGLCKLLLQGVLCLFGD
jgi:hypothetical protein